MKSLISILAVIALAFTTTSCTENYANGERIGLVTQFSVSGIIWKSWEGHLNLTQTGMNSSSAQPFDFSIDNDRPDEQVIALIDSAANQGWKIKLTYHETYGKNWFLNRGETSHFITKVEILDRNPIANAFNGEKITHTAPALTGRVIDTVYVVIIPKSRVLPEK